MSEHHQWEKRGFAGFGTRSESI